MHVGLYIRSYYIHSNSDQKMILRFMVMTCMAHACVGNDIVYYDNSIGQKSSIPNEERNYTRIIIISPHYYVQSSALDYSSHFQMIRIVLVHTMIAALLRELSQTHYGRQAIS
jgi:hypothetical protein